MRVRLLVLFLALSGLVGCDHATKYWAETSLRARPAVPVVDDVVELRYTQNTDVAFNLLRSVPASVRRPVLIGVVTATVVALGVALLRRRRLVELAGLALVLGGAVGNLTDRIARGYVVDFIHFEHWPIFNVADVWVTIGGVLLLLGMRARRDAEPPPPVPSPT
jgi:signal peptidase II